ncbi:hypothetical protein ACJJTC_012874 [Scirpophaga incertulas]
MKGWVVREDDIWRGCVLGFDARQSLLVGRGITGLLEVVSRLLSAKVKYTLDKIDSSNAIKVIVIVGKSWVVSVSGRVVTGGTCRRVRSACPRRQQYTEQLAHELIT